MTRYDAILIGTGQAAPALAARLTAARMTVAVVERNLVGGTCVNTGCTPTKTLVASAQVAHSARRVDAETRRILGAAILGTGGDEAIHGVIDIMNADVPYDVLKWAVPIHPTVSQLVPTLLGELEAASAPSA